MELRPFLNAVNPTVNKYLMQKGCLAQVVLKNGLRVFLVQDHDVPLVKATLLFPGGLRASDPAKVTVLP